MVTMEMTLERVKEAVSMNIALLGNNIHFNDITALVKECKNTGTNPQDLIDIHKRLVQLQESKENDIQSDLMLSLRTLKELLSYKAELDKLGFDIKNVSLIVQAAKQYGMERGPAGVIEAVNKFGGMNALLKEIVNNQIKRKSLEVLVNKLLPDAIARLEEQKRALQEPLRIFNEILKPNGFDENVLAKIAEAANKYHGKGGIKHIMEAINNYVSLEEIQHQVNELQNDKRKLETEVERIQAEKAHLITVIEMCDFLMFKLKFSVSAIQDLVNIAKSYGSDSPIEVFNSLAKYGEMVKLRQEIKALSKEKTELETKIQELEKRMPALAAQVDQMSSLVQSAIVPMQEEYKKGAYQLANVFGTELKALQQESVKQAERIAAEKVFAEELSMARLVAGVYKYPHELLEVPIGIAVALLDAVMRFCQAREVNPKTTLMNFVGQLLLHPSTTIETSYMLQYARSLISSGLR
jgi:hypothetical protein